MSFTVSQLATATISKLQGTASDELNILASSLDAQATDYQDTVTLSYPLGGCVPGVLLSIDDEAMYVLTVSEQNNTAIVLRGQKGSTPVAHTQNAIVNVDPPWPRWVVLEELQAEIRSWGPQVFQVITTSIAIAPGVVGYDLGYYGDIYERVRVYRDPPPWVGLGGDSWGAQTFSDNLSWPSLTAELRRDQSIDDFPSGNALILKTLGLTVPSSVWVVFTAPFDVDSEWEEDTDLIDDVGLDASDLDIPALGAAWRLLSFRQPRRLLTNIAGQPKDAQDVPALSLMQAALQFKSERDSRLGDAQIRLMQRFPVEIAGI